jgi:hypothetical protein
MLHVRHLYPQRTSRFFYELKHDQEDYCRPITIDRPYSQTVS